MSNKIIAYVGLGSNIDSPVTHVGNAFDNIANIDQTELLARSGLYQSKSFLPGYPDFINAVAQIATTLSAQSLLQNLLAIEDQHGRVRAEKWGSRTLDLDLLLYGGEKINESNLTVPHPYAHERATVLYPLADINMELCFPNGTPLCELLNDVPANDIQKLEEASCLT